VWRRVVWYMFIDISEEHDSYVFRYFSTLKMEVASSSETSANIHRTTSKFRSYNVNIHLLSKDILGLSEEERRSVNDCTYIGYREMRMYVLSRVGVEPTNLIFQGSLLIRFDIFLQLWYVLIGVLSVWIKFCMCICLSYVPSNRGMIGELERIWKEPVVA
jgi:hypothetical protein